MKVFGVGGLTAAGQSNKSAVTVIGTATQRPSVLQMTLSNPTNPNATDFYIQWAIANFTAAGTAGSSPTPQPMDDGDTAACTAGIAHSAEPTYGTDKLVIALNQRSTFTHAVDESRAFRSAAGTAKGHGVYMKASGLGSNIQPYAAVLFQE